MHKQFNWLLPLCFHIFLQLTSFVQDLQCCKFNPFPYQIVLHRVQKIGAIMGHRGRFFQFRVTKSRHWPSPLDCTGQQIFSMFHLKKTWNFLPKSSWTPNLIASHITMFHPKKNPWNFLTFSVIFSPKSPKQVTRWNEDFSPAKEIRLFLRAFRRACRCLKNAGKTLDFTDGISENWWF